MIFVCLGTKRFSFNRLLEQIDYLIEHNEVQEEVFAQIGQSTYKPIYYNYTDFLSPNEYTEKVKQASLIITHGGTGAIIKALKAGKQVIAVPRRKKFGEHSDDHQLQIVEFFANQGYIRRVDEMEKLNESLKLSYQKPLDKKFVGEGAIVEIIDDFIRGMRKADE